MNIKVVSAIALIVAIFFLVLCNLIYIIYNMYKGKAKLKESIQKAKQKRIEDDEKERQEEEERKAKKKKQEEEFTSMINSNICNYYYFLFIFGICFIYRWRCDYRIA